MLFKPAIFKQSTQGKGDLLSGISLLVSLLMLAETLEREQSLTRAGLSRKSCRSVNSALAQLPSWRECCCIPRWTNTWRGRGCRSVWNVMGNSEEHQERELRWSSWWSKKERKAACSCMGAIGRQSSTAVWLSPVCWTSHVFMRLLGSKWFLSKRTCPLDTKEINSAVSCRWPTLSQESHALTLLESISGINETGVAGERTRVPAFLLQRQFIPSQDEVRICPGQRYITRKAQGG